MDQKTDRSCSSTMVPQTRCTRMDEQRKILDCFTIWNTQDGLLWVIPRTESPQNSENYKQNEQILQQLSKEKQELEEQGYIVSLLGDFNARITPDNHFTFTKYPHKANNNGGLLNNFAKSNRLYCMNPMKWKNRAEASYTYQRDLGIRYDRSIIDYGLGTMEAISLTTSFTIQDSSDFSVESDHSSLLWEFDVKLLNQKIKVELERNPLRKIRKWQSYTKILES